MGTSYIELPFRTCSPAELGIDENLLSSGNSDMKKSLFWPIEPIYKEGLQAYSYRMKCIDEEELVIKGAYNSATAQMLAI